MAGWLLSGLISYAIGRSVARPLLDRWLGPARFERTEAMIERGGVTLLIAVRLIPIIPFSIVCYAAGAARVPLWRYLWTTAVGFLPITAIAVYFGTRLKASTHRPAESSAPWRCWPSSFASRWVVRRGTAEDRSDDAQPTCLTLKR